MANGISQKSVGAAGTSPEAALIETFHGPAIVSRYLLVLAELIETALLYNNRELSHTAILVLAGILTYNFASLVVVHIVPFHRLPVAAILAFDLVLVGLAAFYTGGLQSRFLGQCYLIIFSGSMFYGFQGGVLVGVASALLTAFLAVQSTTGLRQDIRDLIPYFLITGIFTGYLAGRLRTSFERFQIATQTEHERAARDESARRDIELARSIQESALQPIAATKNVVTNSLTHQCAEHLDIAVRRAFAQEVGGDFHMVLSRHDERKPGTEHVCRVGLVLGDVSGKGIPASLVSTSILYLLPYLNPLDDARAALKRLNDDLTRRLPETTFVTMAFAEIDPDAVTVSIWNAGHPPVLRYDAATGKVQENQIFHPLLGIFPDWAGVDNEPREQWPFHTGDVIVLYTDGLIETHHTDTGELFGTERVAEIVAHHAAESADEISDAILSAGQSWGVVTDDLTLIVCKRLEDG